MKLRTSLRERLRRTGFDVVRYNGTNSLDLRRRELLRELAIDLAFDVGANVGQFGSTLRAGGYSERIVSFEPLPDAFAALVTQLDPLWEAHKVALGDETAEGVLFRAGNSWSSSLLPMAERHARAAPESTYVGDLAVGVRVLDEFHEPGRRVFLKIDTQGYEGPVLRGAPRVLADTLLLELELSMTTLYEGQTTLPEALELARGFGLAAVAPGFRDRKTGEILQLEALLVRSDAKT